MVSDPDMPFMRALGLNPCCNGIWSQTQKRQGLPWRLRRLNPCCNGIWSQTAASVTKTEEGCLNPCCNGIWSQTSKIWKRVISCLNPCCNGIWSQTKLRTKLFIDGVDSLNPCCNGIWSQTLVDFIPVIIKVLILVVMEYGLRQMILSTTGGRKS